MGNLWIYGITIACLGWSYMSDRKKTFMSLKKSWKSFENILPEFLSVILFVGLMLAALRPELINQIIGTDSGWGGVLIASVVGAITLIPGFIAFPTAAMLLRSGAGFMQIAAFISSLMMVGVVTMPVEMKYFGKRMTYLRNGLAFIFSLVVALVVGWVVMQG
jgi:uncharacterized membrane protein YraQ (UPF0718 family)